MSTTKSEMRSYEEKKSNLKNINKEDLNSNLNSIFHLEIDTIKIYQRVINHTNLKVKLNDFMETHRKHLQNITVAMNSLEIEIPDYKEDIKGYFLKAFSTLESFLNNKGAILTLKQAEVFTNETYTEASGWNLPPNIHRMVLDHLDDEQRHMEYLNKNY